MKVVHSPSPSANPKKREKINLFENDDPEEVAALCQQSAQQESNKILLRIDVELRRKAENAPNSRVVVS